jgi:21S rRNA (uridine2791-2'-O)-methyltransferase
MSEPWPQTSGFTINTLSRPYRMMNTSGISFKDHAGSMVRNSSPRRLQGENEITAVSLCPYPALLTCPLFCLLQDLCEAALEFASDTLRAGGHFVCKFYQGSEDKMLENKLKKMFAKVFREKPESSRSVSIPLSANSCFGPDPLSPGTAWLTRCFSPTGVQGGLLCRLEEERRRDVAGY